MAARPAPGRENGLPNLLADVLRGDGAEAELLVRYADDPMSLRAEDRERIEAELRDSPQLRDQLRVLRGFDLASALAEPAPAHAPRVAVRGPGLFQRMVELLRGRTGMVLVPLGAAALLALVLLRQGGPEPLTPNAGAPGPVAQVEKPVEPPAALPPAQVAPSPAPALPETEKPEVSPRRDPPKPAVPPSAVAQAPKPPETPELDYVAMAEPVYRTPFGVEELEESGTYVRAAGAGVTLLALAPRHVAHTVSARPTLYWSLSAVPPATPTYQLTITSEDATEPLAQRPLAPPTSPGLQRVDLVALGIELPLNTPLRWSISLRLDPANPSKDVIASGGIERVSETAELAAQLAAAKPLDRASVYAAAGLWYDALAELERIIEAAPNESVPRRHLQSLLEHAGQ